MGIDSNDEKNTDKFPLLENIISRVNRNLEDSLEDFMSCRVLDDIDKLKSHAGYSIGDDCAEVLEQFDPSNTIKSLIKALPPGDSEEITEKEIEDLIVEGVLSINIENFKESPTIFHAVYILTHVDKLSDLYSSSSEEMREILKKKKSTVLLITALSQKVELDAFMENMDPVNATTMTSLFLLGEACGFYDASKNIAEDYYKESLSSVVGVLNIDKRYGDKNREYEKCVLIAEKYWTNGGQMDHAELAEILIEKYPKFDRVTNPDGYSLKSIRDKIILIAKQDRFKKHPNLKGAKKFDYPKKDQHIRKHRRGTLVQKQILLRMKLDDFEKCTGILKNDTGFAKETYSPKVKVDW